MMLQLRRTLSLSLYNTTGKDSQYRLKKKRELSAAYGMLLGTIKWHVRGLFKFLSNIYDETLFFQR